MSKSSDITGKKFYFLTAIKCVSKNPARWLFRCDCGTEKVIRVTNIVNSSTRSCGCWRAATRGCTTKVGDELVFSHRQSKTPEYRAWSAMKNRCSSPTNKSYANYGGRGIRVCDQWASFEAFYADMGPRPSALHSLDRWPDKNGNYEPGNCRWATSREQMNNVRYNRMATHNGRTQSVSAWSRESGIATGTLYDRLNRGAPLLKG